MTRIRIGVSLRAQGQSKCTSLAEFAFKCDRSVKQFRQFLAQMKPKTRPFETTIAIQLTECLEQLVLIFRADSCAGVLNAEFDDGLSADADLSQSKRYRSPFGEFDSVVGQIQHY